MAQVFPVVGICGYSFPVDKECFVYGLFPLLSCLSFLRITSVLVEQGSAKVCDAITLVNIFLRHLGINPQTHPYSGKGGKRPAYDSCGQFCKWSMWLPLFLSLELVIFSYYHNKIADQSNLGKEGRVQADSHFKSTVYHGGERI